MTKTGKAALAAANRFIARKLLPLSAQLGGLALFSKGAYDIAPFLGFLVGGLLLFGVGWISDRGK